nr:MAG TPA: hypothetical protein [Caudoviricetes sp.]
MSFEHCHSCKPPTRYPGCQDHCPHYAADKEKKRRQPQGERGRIPRH